MGPQDSDCGARAHSFLSPRGPSECISVWHIFISAVLSQTPSLVSAFLLDCGFRFQYRTDSRPFHLQRSDAASDLALWLGHPWTTGTEDAEHDIHKGPSVLSRCKHINLVCMVAIPERPAHHHMDADYKVKEVFT